MKGYFIGHLLWYHVLTAYKLGVVLKRRGLKSQGLISLLRTVLVQRRHGNVNDRSLL